MRTVKYLLRTFLFVMPFVTAGGSHALEQRSTTGDGVSPQWCDVSIGETGLADFRFVPGDRLLDFITPLLSRCQVGENIYLEWVGSGHAIVVARLCDLNKHVVVETFPRGNKDWRGVACVFAGERQAR